METAIARNYFALLSELNIPVDFVMSVDPQELTLKNLRVNQSQALLIALSTAYAKAVQQYPGEKMCILQKGNSVTKTLEENLTFLSSTEAGGSVSCIGLDVIGQLEFSEVYFVGMDYAFPDGKMYSSLIADNKDWYLGVTRFHTLEMLNDQAIQSEVTMKVEDRNNNELLTHQTLYLYLRQIEDLIQKYSSCKYYNVLSKGSKIKGAVNLESQHELETYIQKPLSREEIKLSKREVDKDLKNKIIKKLQAIH